MEEVGTGLLDRLDAMQRVAASAPGGPLLVVAGPGTGKTRTLTHRIAYLCAELGVAPSACLAITFTRKAAEELRARLQGLLGPAADEVTVATFHALGLTILRDHPEPAGLAPGFRVADDGELAAARAEAGDDDERYRKLLRAANLVDVDELVAAPLAVLQGHPDLVDRYRVVAARCPPRWRWGGLFGLVGGGLVGDLLGGAVGDQLVQRVGDRPGAGTRQVLAHLRDLERGIGSPRGCPSSATTVSTGRTFPTDAATSALLETYTINWEGTPLPSDPQVLSIAPSFPLLTTAPIVPGIPHELAGRRGRLVRKSSC